MTDESPSVKVSLDTIYQKLLTVEGRVGELALQLPTHVELTKGKQEEYEERLENHGTRLATIDQRMTSVETRLTVVELGQKPRAPWYTVVGGLASAVGGVGSLLVLFSILTRLPPL